MNPEDWSEPEETPSGMDYISLFDEDEVRAALGLVMPPEDAHRIASEMSAIPIVDRPSYGWTDWALDLLAASSPTVLQKVKRFFGGSDHGWEERVGWIRTFRDRNGYSIGCGIEDVVVQ